MLDVQGSAFFGVISFSLGACAGSFITAIAVRILESRPVLLAPSQCFHCGAHLKASMLIPVLSGFWLYRRAPCCGHSVPIFYPICELCSGLLAVLLGALFAPATACGLFVFLVCSALCIVTDFRLLLLSLPVLGVMSISRLILFVDNDSPFHLQDLFFLTPALLSFTLFWAIGKGYEALTHRQGMGSGDKWLVASIGLWVSPLSLMAIISIASLAGCMSCIVMMRKNGQKTDPKLPFGSYLCAAAIPFVFLQFL